MSEHRSSKEYYTMKNTTFGFYTIRKMIAGEKLLSNKQDKSRVLPVLDEALEKANTRTIRKLLFSTRRLRNAIPFAGNGCLKRFIEISVPPIPARSDEATEVDVQLQWKCTELKQSGSSAFGETNTIDVAPPFPTGLIVNVIDSSDSDRRTSNTMVNWIVTGEL